MNFLVLGCNGMAGHMISLYLAEQGHSVTGFARRPSSFVPTIIEDAHHTEILSSILANGHYHSVINCIGVLNRAAEENKADAVFLNAYLPHFLADITKNTQTQLIHMSTDCVFSGKTGHYTEDAFRDGETFYDRSKALGELEDGKNLTLRASIVGPDINENGIGLMNWFMKSTLHGESVQGYTGAVWTGLTTLQLARVVEQAAKERAHGLFNMVPDSSITKYELLQLFSKYLRDGKTQVKGVPGIYTDKSLCRTRFDFACTVPGYDEMISDLARWMQSHRKLYPHYWAS